MTSRNLSVASGLEVTVAGLLNATDHIGRQIRFREWDNNTETVKVITAELRQISHTGSQTHLNYGLGCLNDNEATLEHDQPVSIRPPANYSDVATLAMYDEKV